MKLITKELAAKIPKLYAQENLTDEQKIVTVKLFNPTGAGTWYVLEYDGDDTLFTYVTGLQEDELGYASLAELAAFRGRAGVGIERDLYWKPASLADIKAGKVS